MKVTAKQAHVLENLHRVMRGFRRGKRTASLDGEDCTQQIHSLAARGLISCGGREPLVQIAEPDGVLEGWGGHRRRRVKA